MKTGTIEMEQAQIAKTLVEEDPKLLLSINSGKLWAAIERAYKANMAPSHFNLEDLASVEMLAHEDDLPKA